MDFSLKGRVALVTGAARGIGAAIAEELARAGALVHLADRDIAQAEAKSAEIGEASRALPLDVCDPDSWQATLSDIERSAGNLDILVNNVGLTLSKSIEDTTIEDWRLLMRVNLEGPFIGTKTALPLMKKSRSEERRVGKECQ